MRRAFVIVLTLVCTLGLAGCGDSDADSDPGAGDSGASGQPATTIDITIEGDSVTPNGERVEVKAGQEIELVVQADTSGEIHVHSDPEQELEYGAGTTTLPLTIDKPGIVEVESHALEKTIVQLEVK